MRTDRVFLTGAMGVVGRRALPLLLERGFEVHASVHREPGVGAGSNAVFHRVDLLDAAAVSTLLDAIRPTHLLHLAWITRPDVYMNDPENGLWLESGRAMLRRAAEVGCRRMVVAGSCAEYDWRHSPCREYATPLSDDRPYAAAKNALRKSLQELGSETGTSWAWGRIFHLFGPHEHPNRFVPYVIRCALRNETIRCSHGRQRRDYSHSADVASAFVSLLDSKVQGPVNIGSGHTATLRQIVATITTATPSFSAGVEYGALQANPADPIDLLPDLTRLNRELGWKPAFDLESGLRATIAWWQATGVDATHV